MLWHAIIVLGVLNAVHSAQFRCYIKFVDKFFETPISNPDPLLAPECIDKNKITAIYSGGANNKIDGPAYTAMVTSLLQINYNVISINWEKESKLLPGALSYVPAILASDVISEVVGKSLVELMGQGVDPNKIHLYGHSVGAHQVGLIGARVQKSNYQIACIWGLDPAGPGYDGLIFVNGLEASQAQSVNTVMSNPGKLGTKEFLGKINFVLNCGNDGLQPGCPAGFYPIFSQEGLCSHNRAWQVFSECLLSSQACPAILSSSCSAWRNQTSPSGVINNLGEDFDPTKTGNFYLSTNAASQYSKGQAGITP